MLTAPRDRIAGLRALLPRVQIPLSTEGKLPEPRWSLSCSATIVFAVF